jgi:hypothetical protein
MTMRRYLLDLVDVAHLNSRPDVREFQRIRRPGTTHEFEVLDRNFSSRNEWRFGIFVPTRWVKGTYTSLGPMAHPNREVLAGLERRSIQFAPCTMPRYRGRCYAQVSVSDPSGEQNRQVLRTDDRLPYWLSEFKVTAKKNVTTSRSNDGEHRVAVFSRDDLKGMVRLFIATKAWTLVERFSRDEEIPVRRTSKKAGPLKARALRGLNVCITGFLGMGTRAEVARRLERLGARVRSRPSGATEVLLEGFHPYGDRRVKIKRADVNGVRRMNEADFRRTFGV